MNFLRAVERWYIGVVRALLALAERVMCVAAIKSNAKDMVGAALACAAGALAMGLLIGLMAWL